MRMEVHDSPWLSMVMRHSKSSDLLFILIKRILPGDAKASTTFFYDAKHQRRAPQ